MKVVDLHCDVLSRPQKLLVQGKDYSLLSNSYHIDLEKLKQGDYLVQCFAIFVNAHRFPDTHKTALDELGRFQTMMKQFSSRIAQVFSSRDIPEIQKQGKIGALLTVEGGGDWMENLEDLRLFHQFGARIMSFTWNYDNRLASPNAVPDGAEKKSQNHLEDVHGLKPLGFEFLSEMERLGIIMDVSHLSDAGFRDVCRAATRPFIATHSNARAVCGHVRNLSDDMLRAIADHGGVTGLNYYPDFLDPEENLRDCRSSLVWMVRHISHIRDVAGIDAIALGSDFDGIFGYLELEDCSQLPRLADALRSHGFTSSEIEKIFHKNALRVFQEIF